MKMHSPDKTPFEAIIMLAVGLSGDQEQRHTGIFYTSFEDGSLHVLHLAWHHRMHDDVPDSDWVWAEAGLDEFEQRQLASFCGMIALENQNGRIPYGLGFVPDGFDPNTGAWVLAEQGSGLTCATFVMSVFSSYGKPLVEHQGWPIRSDDETWQKKILAILEQRAPPEHIQYQRSLIGKAARFRPEEVAAAATFSDRPVAHPQVVPRSRQLRKHLLDYLKRK